ncbi:MAG: regulatory iron-sulfur-containing complex subunit RicT [Chloroflexota bacterium]
MTANIVGVRFQKVGKIYHFDASRQRNVEVGDHVVVNTSRGHQLGEVAKINAKPQKTNREGIKSVLRIATPRDLVTRQMWQQKEIEAVVNCQAKIKDLKLNEIKIILAEFTLNGKHLTFLYTNEKEDKKVNLTAVRKAMTKLYKTKISTRQIGPRDAAKIIGGMGACGLEERCCTAYMTEFCPISIKMAKIQGISLAPSEITGMCGRLRCCLKYEEGFYAAARKDYPKRKTVVITPAGEGTVVKSNPISETILVYVADRGLQEFPKDEVKRKPKTN